jgi:hypothetical protein
MKSRLKRLFMFLKLSKTSEVILFFKKLFIVRECYYAV